MNVTIREVGLRDGLQSIATIMPTGRGSAPRSRPASWSGPSINERNNLSTHLEMAQTCRRNITSPATH